MRRAAVGKTIQSVRALHPALRRKLPPARSRAVKGKRIDSVERRGKHQLIELDDGDTLVVHFRMNGDWEIGATSEPLDRFARAAIELTDGTRISLVDRRALSSITHDKKGTSSLPRLGREASDASLDADYLSEALKRKKIAIKPALMDQSVIAGLGNIYAAESLFRAGINPFKIASKLSARRIVRLHLAIRDVLRAAVSGNSTSRINLENPNGFSYGEAFGKVWQVYDREGKSCFKCGARIRRLTHSGRSTYWCPTCQRR